MFVLLLLWIALPALAASTKTWEQTRFDEFEKGVADKVALRSDGKLTLAPRFEEIYDAPAAYLWALARDSKGNLYAGGGPGARVFKIPPGGKAEKIFETEALDIHALVVDRRDHLYAATSPDSKIYRIDPAGRATLFVDPKVKYVWAMAFHPQGDLLLATGDKGEILRVDAAGRASLWFKSEESHIRSLLVGSRGEVIAGTDPGGLVLRIPAQGGDGFVMHQSAKKEITALALGAEGAVYAAGVGTRVRPSLPAPPPPAPVPAPVPIGGQAPAGAASQPPPALPSTLRVSVTGGSEVIRIGPDGAPRKVWSSADDIVYALGLNASGRLVIGTGNAGRVYQLESDHVYSLLVKAAPSQVTALLGAGDGKLYLATGNVGKVYRLGPELEPRGSFESESFDAGAFTNWGRLSWKGATPDGTTLTLHTRTGNLATPAQYWSGWSKGITTPDGGPVESPPARSLQWKAVLETRGVETPMLDLVTVAYRPKNVAPTITEMEITPPNYRFPDPPAALAQPPSLSLPSLGSRPSRSSPAFQPARSMPFAKGHLGVRWLATDENEDEMTFKVEIRGVNERNWKLLEQDVTNQHLSWDSTAFADGFYQVRVTASDEPSNPGGEAQTFSKESDVFAIDNTPPAITTPAVTAEARRLRARFRVADALTLIKNSEYSIDGGDWRLMLPATRLFDARELDYDFLTDEVPPGEHTLAIRVWDANDNLGTAKAVVR